MLNPFILYKKLKFYFLKMNEIVEWIACFFQHLSFKI